MIAWRMASESAQASFDRLIRSINPSSSRRGLVRGVIASLGIAAVHGPGSAIARKKRKRKKLQFNEFGCVDVGNACRGNNANCCSGICEGKKPKKGKRDKSRCVAHGDEGCLPSDDICRFTPVSCGPAENGQCFLTTGGAGYCAANAPGCEPCRTDTDCEPLFGPGAACVVCEILCPEIITMCASAGAPD